MGQKSEGDTLVEENYFTMAHIRRVLKLTSEKGVGEDKIRFFFGPRYDLSGNPHQLTASYELEE